MATTLETTLFPRLEKAFRAAANPERAAGAKAYMRGLHDHLGITAPELRQIEREVLAGLPAPTEVQLKRIAKECWRRSDREWQYFACDYLRMHAGAQSPKLLAAVKSLITTKSWWDTVDTLAAHTVASLVRTHASLRKEMDRWISSENIWLARTAIIHQLGYKEATDADRLFSYCLRRGTDKEFFIRKAIGWALREYSKTDARAVRAFVRLNSKRLSPLSQREALKWLARR